jgi:hypothetical protein
MSPYDVPRELGSTLSRQPDCGACGHEAHSPLPCGPLCDCRDVPVPGIYP